MADKNDEREAAIVARMTESRGALNREQAEIAVDLQNAEDTAKVTNSAPTAKSKKAKADAAE